MRKTEHVVIDAEGRDKDKVFVITEMSAMQAERWATRALLALSKGMKDELPPEIAQAGLAGVAALGFDNIFSLGGVKYEDISPLMDEMMTCVKIMPDPKKQMVVRPTREEDFEELSTLIRLRKELITLHTGFSWPAARSSSEPETGKQQDT